MFQRILLTFILALLPLGAFADTSTQDVTPGVSQPQSADAGLGPSTGASTSDGTSLQPAGTSTLQSTSNDSNGLTAPNSSYLQEPANAESNGNLQVLLGDNADGPQQQLPGTGPNYWAWLFFCLLFAFCVAAATWIMRTRSRNRLVLSTPQVMTEAGTTDVMNIPDGPTEDLPDVGDADHKPTPEPEPPVEAINNTEAQEQSPRTSEESRPESKPSEETATEPAPTTEVSHSAKARKPKKPKRHRRK